MLIKLIEREKGPFSFWKLSLCVPTIQVGYKDNDFGERFFQFNLVFGTRFYYYKDDAATMISAEILGFGFHFLNQVGY